MSTDLCYRDPNGMGWRSYTTGEYIHGGLIDWPSAENTGWAPTGVTLTPYVDEHSTFTQDITLDSRDITLPDSAMFVKEGAQARITRCNVDAFLDINADESGASLYITDSNINGIPWSGPTIGYSRLDIRRCDIRNGQHSVLGSHDTRIEDSILHMQYNDPEYEGGYHNNGFISNGGSNCLLLHCTIDCSTELTPNGGGPTGDASIFGDFGPVHDFTFERCLFKPTTGSYGLSGGWNPSKPYGEDTYNIVVRDCVFERGITGRNGVYGPVTSFNAEAPGAVWENNRYDDGTLIGPDGQEMDG